MSNHAWSWRRTKPSYWKRTAHARRGFPTSSEMSWQAWCSGRDTNRPALIHKGRKP